MSLSPEPTHWYNITLAESQDEFPVCVSECEYKILSSQKNLSREWILAAKTSSSFFFFVKENRLLYTSIEKKGFLLFLPFSLLHKQYVYTRPASYNTLE